MKRLLILILVMAVGLLAACEQAEPAAPSEPSEPAEESSDEPVGDTGVSKADLDELKEKLDDMKFEDLEAPSVE